MACPARIPQEPHPAARLHPIRHEGNGVSRLEALAAYDIDIFMLGGGRKIPLCRKGLGFDAVGLDYLIGKRTEYYVRRQRDRSLMKGDRVAVLGHGIVVVEHADDREVQALLRNRIIVRMRRKDIAWNRQNIRWEAKALKALAP
jgi:hypothetical protein